MIKSTSQKSIIIIISTLCAIISTTILIIFLAQGYIPEYNHGLKIKVTGILSTTSIPKNASVIINDKLYTTTDNSVNLVPGDYQLKIIKDGYLPWTKKVTIQPEMVYQAEAALFKTNPILTPLTNFDIQHPTVNNDFTKFMFTTPASSSSKSNLYLVEIDYLTQLLNKYQPRLIAQNPLTSTEKEADYYFSSDSKQITIKPKSKNSTYVVNLDTNTIALKTTDYPTPLQKINLSKLPEVYLATVATNPADVQFSDSQNKIFYSLNDQYYVYDIEKLNHHLIGSKKDILNPFWLPKSDSIIYQQQNSIKSIEYDGTNQNTIYNSNYHLKTLLPDYDGKRIIVEISPKSNNIGRLYFLTIR